PRPTKRKGVSWGTTRARRSGVVALADPSGSFRYLHVGKRLTANSSQFADPDSRRGESGRLARIRATLWPGDLRLRAKSRLAGPRRGRPDARRAAGSVGCDWPLGIRPQPGRLSRVALYDHAEQDFQFPVRPANPPARVRRYGDASAARRSAKRERRLRNLGIG